MLFFPRLLHLLNLSLAIASPLYSVPSNEFTPKRFRPRQASSLSEEERGNLFDLHEQLVEIPSISGDEIECAEFVREYLSDLGYYVEEVDVSEGRFNVFAYPSELNDQGGFPDVLITTHLDTVPPFIPFERREMNGTVFHYGRGTVDAKGPVAAQVIAAHKFLEARSDTPRLGMLFVVGEETGGDGMNAFAEYASNYTFRAGIFGEPTEGNLASGHKGSLGALLEVGGRAAHSAYEWLGISAIDYLTEGIMALNWLEPLLPEGDLLGNSTINVGRIAGGVASNVVAEMANASVSIRVARSEPGAPEDIKEMVEKVLAPIIERTEEAGGTFNLTFSDFTYPAQLLETDVPGLDVAPMFYGTDIPKLPQVEDRYLYGTGSIRIAHSPNEQLSQDALVEAAEAYGMILEHLFSEES